MTDHDYNPDDAGLLFSRSLDEELSSDERRRLNEMLAASKTLTAQADELRRVDRLVRRWACHDAHADWEALPESVLREVEATSSGQGLGSIDRLVGRWADETPEVDAARFHADVMARISVRSRGTPRVYRIVRVGVPLAAAAAVVLSFTTLFWRPAPVSTTRIVEYAMPSAATQTRGLSHVSFDRAPPPGVSTGNGFATGFAYGSVGVEDAQAGGLTSNRYD